MSQAIAQYHDEERWLAERRTGIGGSEVAAIFGEHPFITARELWERKTGRAPDQEASLVMIRGRELEDAAARRYEIRTGRRTRKVPLKRRPEHPHLHASADRQIIAGTGVGDWHTDETLVGEIKSLGYQSFERIRRNGLAPYMILQGQVEALVFGYPKVSFGLLHADSFRDLAFDMVSDPAAQEMIANEVGEWWERYVKTDTPPPEPSYEALELPKVEGEIKLVDNPDWQRAAAEFAEANAILKEAQEIEKHAREQLKGMVKAMGVRIAEGAGVRCYLDVQEGRRQYAKEIQAIAKAGPLDPAKVQEFLGRNLDVPLEAVMEDLTDHTRLELPEIKGNPFETFRPYVIRGAAE